MIAVVYYILVNMFYICALGEYVLYLRTAKLTSPALHVKIGDVIYYGDMFPA